MEREIHLSSQKRVFFFFHLQVAYDKDDLLGVNGSVVAVVSAVCTNETCHAHSQSSHGIPVVSTSPFTEDRL